MPTQIFVSLPVSNLQNTVRFYESLGYQKNPQFSDETVASFDISDLIHLMLTTHDKFSELTPKQIADPRKVCHSPGVTAMELAISQSIARQGSWSRG